MESKKLPRCKNCIYWQRSGDRDGLCNIAGQHETTISLYFRIYHPDGESPAEDVIDALSRMEVWILTQEDHFCKEFEKGF